MKAFLIDPHKVMEKHGVLISYSSWNESISILKGSKEVELAEGGIVDASDVKQAIEDIKQ